MNRVILPATIRWPFVMTTRKHPRRRPHLAADAYSGWFKGRFEGLMARTACGVEMYSVQTVKDIPEGSELCDGCALADYVRPCVYRFFDAAGQVLYIGCTKDLIGRLQSHSHGRDSREMWARVYRFEYQMFDGHAEALAAEAAEIAAAKPPFNIDVSGKARKPPVYTSRRISHLPAATVATFLPTEVRAA